MGWVFGCLGRLTFAIFIHISLNPICKSTTSKTVAARQLTIVCGLNFRRVTPMGRVFWCLSSLSFAIFIQISLNPICKRTTSIAIAARQLTIVHSLNFGGVTPMCWVFRCLSLLSFAIFIHISLNPICKRTTSITVAARQLTIVHSLNFGRVTPMGRESRFFLFSRLIRCIRSFTILWLFKLGTFFFTSI